mmetsp:Transcript_13049/g.27545  ORF Transcript_13049/g.27545 Transcript_13049/m.27545 type:complete len:227 (+) Transcript_13049:952-1632(+)
MHPLSMALTIFLRFFARYKTCFVNAFAFSSVMPFFFFFFFVVFGAGMSLAAPKPSTSRNTGASVSETISASVAAAIESATAAGAGSAIISEKDAGVCEGGGGGGGAVAALDPSPAASISFATFALTMSVEAVETKLFVTQYTASPEGTLRAKKPIMMGRYCTICCEAAAASSSSSAGFGGVSSRCEILCEMMRMMGSERKQRVSCQPRDGVPSTQFLKSQSELCEP